MVKDSVILYGPENFIVSYKCDGGECYTIITGRCFDTRVKWEFPENESEANRLVALYTSMSELVVAAIRHILLSKDRCNIDYGSIYAMSEWAASLLRSAVNFKRYSRLYNWNKVSE